MELADFIKPEGVFARLKAAGKRQLLQDLSVKAAALTDIPERVIFHTLLERERLGSTGVGRGIAIPHGKLSRLENLVGLFVLLESPIAFEAIDDQPVDLVCLLLAPEGAGADHLKALARISRTLRGRTVVRKMRAAKDSAALFALLADSGAGSKSRK